MTDWKGVFTALVTPFNEDDSLDEDGLRSLIQRQLDAGIHGLVPCGTTGESPALNQAEWERVIEITVAEAKGKATIIAGSGTNNTTVSAERTKRVGELGADGALVITPYYNKPTEDGIVRHFVAIVEAAPDVPIMVYNVPGRTALNLTPATLERLMDLPTIAAVKEASGSLAQVWEIVKLIVGNAVLFSGEDGLNLPIWDVGGVGTVSVLSNLVPELVVEQWKAKMEGYSADAYDLHRRLDRLVKAIFIETSPAPVKYALKLMGLPGGNVRPPLAPMRFESQDAVKQELLRLKLIKN